MSDAAHAVLELPSGLMVDYPLAKLRAFAEEEYATYDGVATTLDSSITIHDITLSVMMNSWLMAVGGRSIYRARERVGRALEHIPSDVSLLDGDEAIPWQKIGALFSEFETISGAKLAVATKILHKKRPELIPMLDTQVRLYYERAFPDRDWRLSLGSLAVALLRSFRDDLVAARQQVSVLRDELVPAGFPLTHVRVLEALIWIKCSKMEPYYSAGSRGAGDG